MSKPIICCVDDEDMVLSSLREQLGRELGDRYDIETASDSAEALEVLAELEREGIACPLVIADQIMPGLKGDELLCEAHRRWPAMKKVMLTGQADAAAVGRAVNQANLYRFLSKPWDRADLLLTVRGAIESYEAAEALLAETARRERVSRELMRLANERAAGPLLGSSARVQQLRASISKEAATGAPLLIWGPPGSGNEATARAVHSESARDAFIFVNGALIHRADELWDGRATGSALLALGGTLYVHAVERAGRETQERLARLIGDTTLDVRVIASVFSDAAARGLAPALRSTLGPPRIAIPPLRERLDDLEELADFFVRENAHRFGRSVERLSEDSLVTLRQYPWPGNVRELRQVVERAVLRAGGTVAEIDEALTESGASFGSYHLSECIDQGGMGEVWRAHHRHLARPAAVKLIRAGVGDESTLARFRREAQATALLRSPHTVELYDFGVADDGRLFYAMELLAGQDLDTLVARDGPMPQARAIWLLRQACRSLQEAHEAGLVHRDIKPANLFVCRLGADLDFLKVLDFGMVSSLGPEDGKLTSDGVGGTPAFISPEAALGEEVDSRADLYSLGCVAFWMLSGQLVFPRKTGVAMAMAHAKDDPPHLAGVGAAGVAPELEALIRACLAKDPARRPASAMELHRSLGALPIEPWTEELAAQWWRGHDPSTTAKPIEDGVSEEALSGRGAGKVTVMVKSPR